ncbi:hypothetical protein [Pseudomonas sp. LB3P31]
MSEPKIVNGYQIKQVKPGDWRLANFNGEDTGAGSFPTEAMAIEVASVLELEHASTAGKRGKDKR